MPYKDPVKQKAYHNAYELKRRGKRSEYQREKSKAYRENQRLLGLCEKGCGRPIDKSRSKITCAECLDKSNKRDKIKRDSLTSEEKEEILEQRRLERLDVQRCMVNDAKRRARDNNLPFNITVEDIIIPDKCPVLGIPLVLGQGKRLGYNAPALDRIIPELGYVPGNIMVISTRANKLKSNGTLAELEAIVAYVKRETVRVSGLRFELTLRDANGINVGGLKFV